MENNEVIQIWIFNIKKNGYLQVFDITNSQHCFELISIRR